MQAPLIAPVDSHAAWHALAQQLRVDSIRSSTVAGSGHPTSSLSAADVMAVLMAKYFRYDYNAPQNPNNDHLIFSKGHASPLIYAMYRAANAITDEELLTFRKFGSRLQGHPTPLIPWTDVATGSLGQGLPIAVGVALCGKYLDALPYHVWVVLGDSETAEGSVWEALDKAAHYNLNNLTAIIDMNRLGQRGETELGWNSAMYAARVRSFGCLPLEVDGHNLAEIDAAFAAAKESGDVPTVIIARTEKGHGVSFLADKPNWHGKALSAQQAQEAIVELGGNLGTTVQVQVPEPRQPRPMPAAQPVQLPIYDPAKPVATRKAYGDALVALGAARGDVVVMDAEVSNSTHADQFAHAYPDRFFEMFIAEQQLVASAIGMSVRHRVAFASTFAAFFSRAFDFVRMAAISRANIRLSGSHAGVSIGEDGPSQMALEDLAAFRAVHGSTVLYPSDATSTVALVATMADLSGIIYLRTTRGATAILYPNGETFPIGGSKVLRQSEHDQVTIVAAGITVHETLKAFDQLQSDGIAVRVIDAYSIKPIDAETLRAAAQATGGRILTVEDHWPEGGLGDAVLGAFAGVSQHLPTVVKLAVTEMPGSGTPDELLNAAGINAPHIAAAVRAMLKS